MKLQRWLTALLLVAIIPASADAQRRRPNERAPQYWNRFSLEPYAGAFKDAYDASDSNTGYLVGLRVGYEFGWRGRAMLNAAFSEVDDVFSPSVSPDFFVYDNNWIFTTIGGEFDVIPGNTSASIGVHGGAAWRKVTLDERIGDPIGIPEDDEGYSAQGIVVPGLTLRHRLSTRAALSLAFEDYIFDLSDGPVDHSPALSLGFTFR